jgi:hypothetical protein
MAAFPNNCGANDYGYPYLVLLMKRDGAALCSSGTITLAMINTAIAATDQDHMIVLGPITNGVRAESERQEESGADTIDGMMNVISQTIQITGKLKFLNETVIEDLENLNCEDRLRMWIVTNTGWMYGGCNGYNVANFISSQLHDGFGTRGYIPLDYKWKHTGVDRAVQDDDSTALVNS